MTQNQQQYGSLARVVRDLSELPALASLAKFKAVNGFDTKWRRRALFRRGGITFFTRKALTECHFDLAQLAEDRDLWTTCLDLLWAPSGGWHPNIHPLERLALEVE